jgi:hypothetical protein
MGCRGSEVRILSHRPFSPKIAQSRDWAIFLPRCQRPIFLLLPNTLPTVPSLIVGMFFIQNRLKPLASIARIRNFSAGNGYREVEIRVMESPTGLQSNEASTHDASS